MYLQNLNEKQKEAVTDINTHLRVVAGAGSGKTRVITTRIAYLLENGILPYRILAITFTNKAANEMKERVNALLKYDNNSVNISTIHSFCVRVLREEIRYFDYPKNFTILDSEDQKSLLRQIYKMLEISVKDYSFSMVLSYISNNKCALVEASEAKKLAGKYPHALVMAEIYELYEEKLKQMMVLDFDDLLLFVYRLFKENKEIRRKWQNRYDYIHVDEFQDIDFIQYDIIKNLVSDTSYLCVVGDPDQTIYTWRGASVDIILNLEKDFKDIKSIVLNENYRSTPMILQGANSLIKNNMDRIKKDLYTNNKGEEKITYYKAIDEKEEVKWIVRNIEKLNRKDVSFRDIAILYRSNFLSRSLEKELLDHQIPYRIYGGIKFFERAEIKDAISYLRLLADNESGSELAISRVINTPKRGVGPKAMETLALLSETYNCDYYTVLKKYPIAKGKVQKEVENFVSLIEKYRKEKEVLSISIVLKQLLEESGYIKSLEEHNESERLENINELIHDIETYEENENVSLEEYLQMISLYTDHNEQSENRYEYVQLMSVHAAKGLEFDYVFVYELSEGIFPNERSVDEGGRKALEEERRLAYVAFTRAKKKLYLTSSSGYSFVNQKLKTPSRFIREMDADVLEEINGNTMSIQKAEYKYNAGDYTISNRNSNSLYSVNKKDKLKKGDLVLHEVFKEGVVISIKEGVVQVAFDKKYGIRKFASNTNALIKK